MKYKLNLDNNDYLLGFIHTATDEDTYELDAVNMNLDYINCYHLVNNVVIWDETKYRSLINIENIKQEISRLKDELNLTDYKIIKCSEYQLAGLEMPYDIVRLHQDRQALRDRINELEN